jgi:glycogen debranching enzyme
MTDFKIASDVVEQFGNMIALRKTEEQAFPGIAQLFVASVLQCQPLAEVEVLASDGKRLELVEEKADLNPVCHKRVFGSELLSVQEEIVVHDNEAALRLTLVPKTCSDLGLTLRISGGVLMSPQGVPYHWEEEKLIHGTYSPDRVQVDWRDKIRLALTFSQPMDEGGIMPLREEDVAKKLYFRTFNAKKRYRYWIEREVRTGQAGLSTAEARNLAYCGTKAITLKAGQEYTLEVLFAVADNPSRSFAQLYADRDKAWTDFLAQVPEFISDHQELVETYYKSWFVLFANRMAFDEPRFKYPFTSVNKFHYYNQFFWDSGFHAIPWIWFNDKEPAQSELKNFVLNQWRNGMIPYELFLYDVNGREWMETDAKTTAATQPPTLAISLMEIFAKFGDKEFLEFFYEPLLRYEDWLWRYRDLGRRGLSYVFHIWESGTDNSPKFDPVHKNRLLDPALEVVDFNVFIYLLRQAILKMADILGKEPPARIKERIALTKQSANEVLLDKEDGFYYDVWADTDKHVKVKAFSGVLPLITDWPDEETRERLLNDYLLSEKEFNTECPVPSVSVSEPTFASHDFWRGANWPQITWTFVYGLKRNSHAEAASIILDKYLAQSTKRHFCNEYCDSVTGQDVGLPFQGWGTLYIDHIIRHLCGLEPTTNGFQFHPLSTRYKSLEVRNIRIGDMQVSVKAEQGHWLVNIDGQVAIKAPSQGTFTAVVEDGKLVITGPAELQVEQAPGQSTPVEIRNVN